MYFAAPATLPACTILSNTQRVCVSLRSMRHLYTCTYYRLYNTILSTCVFSSSCCSCYVVCVHQKERVCILSWSLRHLKYKCILYKYMRVHMYNYIRIHLYAHIYCSPCNVVCVHENEWVRGSSWALYICVYKLYICIHPAGTTRKCKHATQIAPCSCGMYTYINIIHTDIHCP